MADDAAVPDGEVPARKRPSPELATLIVGFVAAVALTVLVGWLGAAAYQVQAAAAHRDQLVAVARQEAENLTTIDYQDAAADVQRVLDLATGSFYASFSRSAPDLIETVEREQSKAVGTVTAAGLASEAGNQAQVLVTVNVRSKHLGGLDKAARQLRMRVLVLKADQRLKVADMEIVP